jgi:hypothetical protein
LKSLKKRENDKRILNYFDFQINNNMQILSLHQKEISEGAGGFTDKKVDILNLNFMSQYKQGKGYVI